MGGGGHTVLTPRLVWAFPAGFLCLLLVARVGVAVWLGTGAAGAAVAGALFALPLLYTVPRGRLMWNRHRGWLLAAQTVLTYLPFVMFGQEWAVGLSGLLAGLVLLTLRAPLSWLLFAAILALEGLLRIGVIGIYPEPGVQFYTWVFVVPVNMALMSFGLVRLADLVTELRAARTELAALAITQERLQAAARLRAAVSGRLEAVAAQAKAALAALHHHPDQARAHLTGAAGIARQALEQVRETVPADPPGPSRPAPPRIGDTLAPRLALLVLVAVLGSGSIHHLAILADTPASGWTTATGVAAIVAIAALQLYHSLARRGGARPRAWGLTLATQTLLPYTLFGASDIVVRFALLGLPGFPAGSALLLLPRRWAWPVFAVVATGMGGFWALSSEGDLYEGMYLVGVAASTGLAVYGLSRLTDVARELEVAREELARTAVERERARVARDTHDLLGLGLSAVALKSDLAERLVGHDDARARRELDALVKLAAQTRAEIRSVTAEQRSLSLRTALAAAEEVLASVGIAADVRAQGLDGRLSGEVEATLAMVLREAVTNVLRHSSATRCEIELTASGDAIVLRVANDGVTDEADRAHGRTQRRGRGGHGLVNLAARAEVLRRSSHHPVGSGWLRADHPGAPAGGNVSARSHVSALITERRIPPRRQDRYRRCRPRPGALVVGVGGPIPGPLTTGSAAWRRT